MAKHSQIKLENCAGVRGVQPRSRNELPTSYTLWSCYLFVTEILPFFALYAATVEMLMSAEMTAQDTRAMIEISNLLTKL